MATAEPRRNHNRGEEDDEVAVLREDQEKISNFSRLNFRRKDRLEEAAVLKLELQRVNDAVEEATLCLDSKGVLLKVGESFICGLDEMEISQFMEERKKRLNGKLEQIENEIHSIGNEMGELKTSLKEQLNKAVFPCILEILPQFIINKKDPIILGVKVAEGLLKVNTPLCIAEKDNLLIGRVTSIEKNKKTVDHADKGDEVAIKIIGDPTILVGRHFDHTNTLYSKLTRDSIDCLKEYFRDELTKDLLKTIVKIKKVFGIV